MADKNMRVRVELTRAGLLQSDLVDIEGLTKQEVSILLNKKEWSKDEQNETIRRIREYAKED